MFALGQGYTLFTVLLDLSGVRGPCEKGSRAPCIVYYPCSLALPVARCRMPEPVLLLAHTELKMVENHDTIAVPYVPGTSTLGLYQLNALRALRSSQLPLLTPPTRGLTDEEDFTLSTGALVHACQCVWPSPSCTSQSSVCRYPARIGR